ncbi:hypothetical protein WJX77_005969 [Trebouxia sp. C0004]
MAPAVFAMLLLAVAAFQLILYLVMETLYKRFSHGKFTYASLPVLHPPKALQPSSKLDAAMLSQHDIDSRDDSAPEHPDTGLGWSVNSAHLYNGYPGPRYGAGEDAWKAECHK